MKREAAALSKLSGAELEIMRKVWELSEPVTVSRMLEIFFESRKWKTSTLSTLLDRLIEKGFLTKTLKGKVNFYAPLLTEDDYKERETQAFLSSVHNGSVKSFIAALADGGISPEEVRELRAWFQEKSGER
ncbi:MAG: BlaI/MecI/CopY family transcriptional regulator [Clostridiales bacterium]|jgi:BlaI family penicillinase repressor|nr:BlaI/MecI/CopY family transcriptional regulator [Clostridiales bacterium]